MKRTIIPVYGVYSKYHAIRIKGYYVDVRFKTKASHDECLRVAKLFEKIATEFPYSKDLARGYAAFSSVTKTFHVILRNRDKFAQRFEED